MMSEIRRDLVKNNWVAVAADRALKPNDFPIAKKGVEASAENAGFCPFCEGNEHFTPPEIAVYGRNSSEANTPGWLIRTIPNKFSAFPLVGDLEKKTTGIYTNYNGLGQHEVIIETPEHGSGFHSFDVERIEMIAAMLKERYNCLREDPRIKYIQIYKNCGMFGGASLEHSHSQIVGLPFVPQENQGLPQYYAQKGSCLLCDMLKQEQESKERVIYESECYLVLCPYAPRFAYETWIVPKRHTEHFGQMNDIEVKELAALSKRLTTAILDCLNNPSYNFVINTAPVNASYEPGYHWYMEITPRLLVAAGVEVATGVYMNPVAPEVAAQMLKESFHAVR
ncbi:MAG: DUF4931 domain-containing protein [Bacillota bacterium]|nr:DUF4931 domain-containing protein [Bacillota bacterium]